MCLPGAEKGPAGDAADEWVEERIGGLERLSTHDRERPR